MRRTNIENERVKREYLAFLKESAGRTEATPDIAAAAIDRFEAFNGCKPFKAFRREQAISFKAHLAKQRSERTGKPLAKATLYSTLKALRAFFEWLSREHGFRRTLVFSDAAYFNPSENDARIATAAREQRTPSLEQVLHVIATMPASTAVQRRDRAVVAFILLTGARDSAAASFRLKHVDLARRTVAQDAREVATKRAKTFTTAFFPVGTEVEGIVADWFAELTRDHLFGPDDPLFPATAVGLNEGLFSPMGLHREPWAGAGPIRAIFKRAFTAAALPYAHPHSLRRTITALGYSLNLTPRELKAWSQNLGHDSVLTTLSSYGHLRTDEQVEVMAGLGAPRGEGDAPEVAALIAQLRATVEKATTATGGPRTLAGTGRSA